MRRVIFVGLAVVLVTSLALTGFTYKPQTFPSTSVLPIPAETKTFGLADIPEIKNKQAVNTILETGRSGTRSSPTLRSSRRRPGSR